MKIVSSLNYIYGTLSKTLKYELFIIIFFTTISSFFEFLSLGSIIPFITVLSNPNFLFENIYFLKINKYLSFDSSQDIILPVTITFIIVIFITGFIRTILTYLTISYAEKIAIEINISIYKKAISRSYEQIKNKPSSEIISLATQKVFEFSLLIFAILQGITALILTFTIIFGMLILKFQLSLLILICFGALFLMVVLLSSIYLKKNSSIIASEQYKAISKIQDSLGTIKEIILSQNQDTFVSQYLKIITKIKSSIVQNNFLSKSPRFIIETFGAIFISIIAYFLIVKNNNNIEDVIAGLAIIGLGATRLFPLLNQMYFTWSSIVGYSKSLLLISEFLSTSSLAYKINKDHRLKFNKDFKLQNISFSYGNNSKSLFNNISIKITKNSLVAIIGKSGSGKSTLMDIMMGLLKSKKGILKVDDVEIDETNIINWQKKISYVSQKIFLLQDTFAKNIAFGSDQENISHKKLIEVSKKADIYNLIKSKKNGFNENILEGGSNLSGGQIQRIGLARALYKNSEIIFLDEATSSLDLNTEKNILNELYKLKKENITIIFSTHKVDNLSKFDQIIDINNLKLFRGYK